MKTDLPSSTFSTCACALLAATCFAATATAQGADSVRLEKLQAELQKRFTAADADADGKLTREEAKAGMPLVHRNFDTIDTEKADAVSLAQITAFAAKQRGRR